MKRTQLFSHILQVLRTESRGASSLCLMMWRLKRKDWPIKPNKQTKSKHRDILLLPQSLIPKDTKLTSGRILDSRWRSQGALQVDFSTSISLLMLSESWFASFSRRSPSPRTSCASCFTPLTAERFLCKKNKNKNRINSCTRTPAD